MFATAGFFGGISKTHFCLEVIRLHGTVNFTGGPSYWLDLIVDF
jgi:hypothetical protein